MRADGGDLAGGDPAWQRAAEADGLAYQELLNLVGRGQPVDHRDAVTQDPGGRPGQPGGQDQPRPAQQRAAVALGHAQVDGPSDQRRHDRQHPHPGDAGGDPGREHAELPARHPRQEAGR
jgi:hypothetical protein